MFSAVRSFSNGHQTTIISFSKSEEQCRRLSSLTSAPHHRRSHLVQLCRWPNASPLSRSHLSAAPPPLPALLLASPAAMPSPRRRHCSPRPRCSAAPASPVVPTQATTVTSPLPLDLPAATLSPRRSRCSIISCRPGTCDPPCDRAEPLFQSSRCGALYVCT